MSKQNNSMLWILVLWFLIILMLFALYGCASREVSSTDYHHRVPEVHCAVVKYQGQMRELCCESGRCAFTN